MGSPDASCGKGVSNCIALLMYLSISFAEQLGETDETELALAIPSNMISFASSSETEIRLFDYLTVHNCLNLQLPEPPIT